jgi:hypothetical protein
MYEASQHISPALPASLLALVVGGPAKTALIVRLLVMFTPLAAITAFLFAARVPPANRYTL